MEESGEQIVNFDRICRLCLNDKQMLTDIFEPTADNNNFSIDQKIMACATIALSKNDGLPSRICIKCLTSVNAAFDFRVQCENADKTLHILHNLLNSETDKNKPDKLVTSIDAIIENGNEEIEKDMEEEEEEEEEDMEEKGTGSDLKISGEKSNEIDKKDVKFEWKASDSSEENDLPIHEFVEISLNAKEKKSEKRPRARRKGLVKKVHKCEPCGKSFNAKKSLVRHNLSHHGTGAEKQKKLYECSVCLEIFTRLTDLYEHQKNFGHHEKEKCDYCDKYFSRSYMVEHLRNHTGEKPYLCNMCGRSFGQVSSFYKHKKLCSNAEKKLKCSFCDRRYYERYTLMEHERIHTNEKPFICETCGKAFRRKGKLHIHQLSHTNVKPHTCNVCNRSFRQRGHLTEHLRIHSGVKPFTCDICGAAFTQGHSLKTHKMRHPEEKIDLEQVILLKKGESEDKLEEENENLFYIIKDNDGGLEGIISDAEIIYFDNGNNSEVLSAESADGKIATEIEGIDEDKLSVKEEEMEEDEVEEEVEENAMIKEGEKMKYVREEGGEVNCGKIGFELNIDSSRDNNYKIWMKSPLNDVPLKKAQVKALGKNGDELQKAPCPFCHKMLTRVEEHVRLMHRNRVYICNKFGCGAQFVTLKNLQSHQLSCYDIQKAHKCPYCFKEFHRKSNYKAHVKRHNNKKEFKCELCDSAFVDTTGLRRHFLKHHEPDRELFVSNCCGKRFKSKEGLKKHINKRICGIQVLEVVDPSPIELPM